MPSKEDLDVAESVLRKHQPSMIFTTPADHREGYTRGSALQAVAEGVARGRAIAKSDLLFRVVEQSDSEVVEKKDYPSWDEWINSEHGRATKCPTMLLAAKDPELVLGNRLYTAWCISRNAADATIRQLTAEMITVAKLLQLVREHQSTD